MKPDPLRQLSEVKQLDFFNQEDQNAQSPRNTVSAFNDPAFASNKTIPLHRWVPWIAGFSGAFVRDVLEKSIGRQGTVLDPFAGVGTTLVEALLAGHTAIGFEINPYAALACRTKTNAAWIDTAEMRNIVALFLTFYRERVHSDYAPHSQPPKGFKTRGAFYSPSVLRKVLIIQDFIRSIEQQTLRDIFRLAFASTMVTYSNYSYEPSLGRRVSAGKAEIDDFPVGEALNRKLVDMLNDIEWLQKRSLHEGNCARVINDSFFQCQHHLAPNTADIVITSPPYLNNYSSPRQVVNCAILRLERTIGIEPEKCGAQV